MGLKAIIVLLFGPLAEVLGRRPVLETVLIVLFEIYVASDHVLLRKILADPHVLLQNFTCAEAQCRRSFSYHAIVSFSLRLRRFNFFLGLVFALHCDKFMRLGSSTIKEGRVSDEFSENGSGLEVYISCMSEQLFLQRFQVLRCWQGHHRRAAPRIVNQVTWISV